MNKFKQFKDWYQSENTIIPLLKMFLYYFLIVCVVSAIFLDIYMICLLPLDDIKNFNVNGYVLVIKPLSDNLLMYLQNIENVLNKINIFYIPFIVATISVIGIFKTTITKHYCILNGLSLFKVLTLNIELFVIFLVPYFLQIFLFLILYIYMLGVICECIERVIHHIKAFIETFNDNYNNAYLNEQNGDK